MKAPFFSLIFAISASLSLSVSASATEPLPIDPLWKSEAFRRAFTGSYGVDSRIEPPINTEEKALLDSIAQKMSSDDRAGAIAALTSSELLSKSAPLIFNLGNLRFEEGQLEDATENFKKAIELYPNFRDGHRNLAVALIQQNEFDDAEPHLTRAIELGARDGATIGLLGYVHAVAERHQPALQAYRLAQLTMPGEIQWQLGEAQALLALGDTTAAESLFDSLIQRQPDNRDLWLRQASLWFGSSTPENAIANMEFAHRLNPLTPSERLSLGHLYLNEGLLDRAQEHYLAAITADIPPPIETALAATKYLVQLEKWAVFHTLAEAISTSYEVEENAAFTRQRALYELAAGDHDKGAALVEALLAANPLDGQALIILARYRDREDKSEEATHLLEQATKVPETQSEALLQLGQRAVEAGDYERALQYLEESDKLESRPSLKDYIEQVRQLSL